MAKNKKRLFSAISFVISAVIFALAVGVFVNTLRAKSQNRPAEIFGYSFAVVATGSMYPEIKVGDLIIVKSCEISQISVGDNAVFIGLDDEYKDKCIVHRVTEVRQEDGQISLVTKGINNDLPDENPVTQANFIGKEVFHSSWLGAVMRFLQNPVNWLYMLVILIAAAVIVTQTVRIIKLRKKSG